MCLIAGKKNEESCCPESLSAGQIEKIVAGRISPAALCWLKSVFSSQHCPSSDYLCATEHLEASGTDKYRVHAGV